MRGLLILGALLSMIATIPSTSNADSTCEHADLNGDRVVDQLDIEIFRASLGRLVSRSTNPTASEVDFSNSDIDRSGEISMFDFALLLSCR